MQVIHDGLYIKEFNELFEIKEKSREIIYARTTLSSRNRAKRPSKAMALSSGYNCCGASETGCEHAMRDEPNVIDRGFLRDADDRDHLPEQNLISPFKAKK